MGCTTSQHFLMYFLCFFSVAKDVTNAEVSNKCVWVGVCTVTLWREQSQRFFRCDQSYSLAVPVTDISGEKFARGTRNPKGATRSSSMQKEGL